MRRRPQVKEETMQSSTEMSQFATFDQKPQFAGFPKLGNFFTRDAVLELSERAAELAPSSFNAERYTVDVIFSSGAAVERTDLQGRFLEVLEMSASAADLSEFVGAPVLDAHNRASSRSIYGTVSAARIDSGRGLATIQLSRTADAAPIVDRIREGSLRNVSIGYQVLSVREERTNGQRTLVATRWKPKELSFVPIGADPLAQVRSDPHEIRSMAALMGLPATFAESLVTRALTMEQARTEILTEMQRSAPRINPVAPALVTRDVGEGLAERIADGLLVRMDRSHQPTSGRPYTYCRMADVARICLETRGLSTLGSPAQLIERAMHTTSDFPSVLAELFNKNLSTITRTPSPVVTLFRASTVADFRAKHFMDISDGPLLAKVNESGEVTFGTITDKTIASYAASSYAKAFTISFQALTNDDMGALQDISAKMTRGARAWFEGFLVGIIISNPLLADGQATFSAAHANLSATPAAPTDASIAEGKLGMRLQQDLSGNPLNLMPRYIFIPAALETTVDQLLATLYPQQPAEAVVAARTLTPIVDSRLDQAGQTKSWYLFCDPSTAAVFEYSDLEGYSGPQVQAAELFTNLGTSYRVVWHVGAGAVDSRGGWKNAGV
jgi:hypothetical protein